MTSLMFNAERYTVLSNIMDIIEPGHPSWNKRFDIEAYVWKCKDKGFVNTKSDVHNVIRRWLDGKRAITPPGARKLKKLAKERKKGVPEELKGVVAEVVANNAKVVSSYKEGNEKSLNVLMGQTLKKVKYDPAIVKDYIKGLLDDSAFV